MKTSRRNFLKTTAATGMGSAALAEFGAVEAGATQSDQVKNWDYEAGVVVLGTGAAGLMTDIAISEGGPIRRRQPRAKGRAFPAAKPVLLKESPANS